MTSQRPSWCLCDPMYFDRDMEDPACRHSEMATLYAAIDLLRRQPCRHERILDEIAAHCQTAAGAEYVRNMFGPRR